MRRNTPSIGLSALTIAFALVLSCGALDAAPTEQVVYTFHGSPGGALPEGSLIFDAAGHLVGTTTRGGTGGACSSGCGTIFRLTRGAAGTWKETVLHSFNLSDGAYPAYAVVFDAAGNLYGTTGVAPVLGNAYGLFNTPSGWQIDVLHEFRGGRDGSLPASTPVFDKHGNLFATTSGGGNGTSGGGGTIFELTPQPNGRWKETIIHRFGSAKDGAGPQGGLLIDDAGHVYGSTVIGGNISACPVQHGCGVVFKLAPGAHETWTYSVLHKFNNGQDGILPTGLLMGAKGHLYGTTISGGGAANFGVVFEVTP